MKWFKYVFAVTLLLLALPVWRLLDWANVMLPFPFIYKTFLFSWFGLLILLPLKLILKKLTGKISLALLALYLGLLNLLAPLSSKAVLEPTQGHCGPISYTGIFYGIRPLLSSAHQDDLELRNQLCWITKMIKKVPAEIAPDELEMQLNLLKNKLLKPQYKYRASLPWITFLIGAYFSATPSSDSPIQRALDGKLFAQNFNFWTQLYADEISAREYEWHDWPHSALMKAEYGFIEKNWEQIHIQFNK